MTGECPSCGAEQSQAWLCSDCCAAVETMLAATPQLIDQLDLAIAKQARVSKGNYAGSAQRPTSADDELGSSNLKHERLPLNWGVVAVRDALVVEAAFIGEDINWIRRHPQAAEMVRDFGKAVANGYRAIDRARDREYLGTCGMYDEGHEDAPCQAELWAKPGAKEIECRTCHHVHNVSARRLDLLEMAEDSLFTVREASQMLGDVGGITVTEHRIRGYLRRGKRLSFRPGTNMIRLGDLLAVVLDDGERKSA